MVGLPLKESNPFYNYFLSYNINDICLILPTLLLHELKLNVPECH